MICSTLGKEANCYDNGNSSVDAGSKGMEITVSVRCVRISKALHSHGHRIKERRKGKS